MNKLTNKIGHILGSALAVAVVYFFVHNFDAPQETILKVSFLLGWGFYSALVEFVELDVWVQSKQPTLFGYFSFAWIYFQVNKKEIVFDVFTWNLIGSFLAIWSLS